MGAYILTSGRETINKILKDEIVFKRQKKKKGRRGSKEDQKWLTTILNGVIRVGLTEVTCEQRLERGTEIVMLVSSRKVF